MKRLIYKIRTSIWLYPAVYSLFAIVLSIVVALIDDIYSSQMAHHFNDLFYTTVSLAQGVLGIIASAFITIATFTFSTTMIVLTMYSSQYTPRVVENFLYNRTTMKSFGVFLSGFIYAITSLLFLKINEEGNFVIAASIGIIYIIWGLIYFLRFIHNVSIQIQESGLILRLYEKALGTIREHLDFIDGLSILSETEMYDAMHQKKYIEIFPNKDGYIQEVLYFDLQKISKDNNCIICSELPSGQFVSTETRIITVYYEDEPAFDESITTKIQRCFLIGNNRTEEQDIGLNIQKIVEIAVKALSPGINDPNTAIHCLQIIGLLLREIAHLEKGAFVLKGKDENDIVICKTYDFEVMLYDAYTQIIFYGKSDSSVMAAVFESLRFAKAKASIENKRLIDEYAANLFEKQAGNGYDEFEYRKLSKEFMDLR